MNKKEKEEDKKEFEPRRPDFTNDGVAVWKNTDKDGKEYITIKIVGHTTMYAMKQIQ
jgi:hypothetical protein